MTKTEINTVCKLVFAGSEADRELGFQYLENLKDSNLSSTGAFQLLVALDKEWTSKTRAISMSFHLRFSDLIREIRNKVWHTRVKLKHIRL